MSIYIKGMEMPTSCRACMFSRTDIRNTDWCVLTEKDLPCDCPIVPVPDGGIGEISDGYHTFNGLYYQRMVLFAALVNAYQDRAWKSWKHEDGNLCFDGGWFIVGIDTPKGNYTYHYEEKYWSWFECEELPVAKHWDGHTEADVTRLLSLPDVAPVVRCKDCRHRDPEDRKCDSGETERQGCLFPVHDDYFCAYGEKMDGGEGNGKT